jgi:DHA1 family bicyclomycin/chloramphenicol resistance-like MFS transporter
MVMACVFLAAALLHWLSVPLVVGAMFIYTIGAGLASPAALTSALGVSPRLAGSASGLYGCIQMGIGALCTVLGGIGEDPALAASLTLVGAGVVSQAGFWVAARETKRQVALRHHQHRASTHADFTVSDF